MTSVKCLAFTDINFTQLEYVFAFCVYSMLTSKDSAFLRNYYF